MLIMLTLTSLCVLPPPPLPLPALIPRPAAQFDDPPLYLCLKLRHAKRPDSDSCPMTSYAKTAFKPEYWFSIPKDKLVACLFLNNIHAHAHVWRLQCTCTCTQNYMYIIQCFRNVLRTECGDRRLLVKYK